MLQKSKTLFAIICLAIFSQNAYSKVILGDSTKTYSMPTLGKTPKGEVMLSWTEKDKTGLVSFCFALSNDNGKTFSDKKIIFSSAGMNNSRLMRAKLLFKNDGTMAAVFTNRADIQLGVTDAPMNHQAMGNKMEMGNKPNTKARDYQLVCTFSKDNGSTWTTPKSVDADPKTGIVRGFFDAVVMKNDEIAVFYLKDVANSTKHEERDLRMVTTKSGEFLPEKIIDPVVCDCCNISALVDNNGTLNVYYRDNNDDVRDIAKISSNDNAATFSKPQILHNDNWKIAGCPHSGAVSSANRNGSLIAWFSGSEKESGIRLVTNEGKKLCVLNNPSAKNACITSNNTTSVILWEQNVGENDISQIAYKKINADKISETFWVNGSANATNATSLLLEKQILVAYEVKQANKKNSIKLSTVEL
jgi:BNR repeat-like domain